MANGQTMRKDPLLSIIMPVYNEKDAIKKSPTIVLAVPYKKEVIVVDDGSTDGTWKILKSLHYSGLTCVHPAAITCLK